MKLIVYIPAFNEELNIEKVINNLPKKITGVNHVDYLVVDDGSTDKTAALARSSGAQVISHYRNQGVGAAFHSAVQFALENGADIPPGFAHGFYVISRSAEVIYKTTDYYDSEGERQIRWNDPELAIHWSIPTGQTPLLSEKDNNAPLFKDAEVFL